MQEITRKNEKGFSMIELLIVVAVLGIIVVIAVMNSQTSKKLIVDKVELNRLQQLWGIQDDYRDSLGKRKYGTLYELSQITTPRGKLLPEAIATFSGTSPQAVDGWLIQDNPKYPPTAASLASGFSITMSRSGASPSDDIYCIHEDGVIRKSTVSAGCTRNSEKVNK